MQMIHWHVIVRSIPRNLLFAMEYWTNIFLFDLPYSLLWYHGSCYYYYISDRRIELLSSIAMGWDFWHFFIHDILGVFSVFSLLSSRPKDIRLLVFMAFWGYSWFSSYYSSDRVIKFLSSSQLGKDGIYIVCGILVASLIFLLLSSQLRDRAPLPLGMKETSEYSWSSLDSWYSYNYPLDRGIELPFLDRL